ncbi:hypothetical protein, partial [Salipiger aestuarii]|uniref:hypothetical protein n=1 Tax=Salipiger aestuarii TaxID=568098 RepID=UPI0016810617
DGARSAWSPPNETARDGQIAGIGQQKFRARRGRRADADIAIGIDIQGIGDRARLDQKRRTPAFDIVDGEIVRAAIRRCARRQLPVVAGKACRVRRIDERNPQIVFFQANGVEPEILAIDSVCTDTQRLNGTITSSA